MRYYAIDRKAFEKFKSLEGFTSKLVKDKMFPVTFTKYFYNGKRVEYYAKCNDEIILATGVYGTLSKRTVYSEVAKIKNRLG